MDGMRMIIRFVAALIALVAPAASAGIDVRCHGGFERTDRDRYGTIALFRGHVIESRQVVRS